MKMSNEKFRIIVAPILAIVLILAVVLSMAANVYSAALDMAFGKGERHVVDVENVSKEALEFYEVKFPNPTAGTLANADPPTAIEEQSRNDAAKTALKVAEEGITLLKNDGVLPLSRNAKVTPFGYRYIEPIWGGSGSAATNMNFDYVVTAEEALGANFSVNQTVVDRMKAATPIEMAGDLSSAPSVATWSNSGSTNMSIFEYDSSIYQGTQGSCAGTVGVVFVGRLGLEGNDLWALPYENGVANHSLQLTKPEREMISFAKENCDKVVVVCNFSNIMEIAELENDSKIDAILWVGNPGAKGLQALTEILVGDVNPSGRTVDIWIADQTKDPGYVNVLNGTYGNEDMVSKNYYEYEEGIYMGYRYYEMAAAEAAKGNYSGFDYDSQVVYPFGYGLHYENDKVTQKLNSVRLSGGELKVSGTITNNSSRMVKESVQLYLEAPYYVGGSKIEKASKVLLDFGKYAVDAGKSENFTFSIPQEELASYDDQCYYSAKGSYVLEEGDYVLHLGKNSHEDWGSETFTVSDTIAYTDGTVKNGAKAVGKRLSDGIVAENQFADVNRYISEGNMTVMTRNNFAGTFPKAPELNKIAPSYIVSSNAAYDHLNDPVSGVANSNATLYKSEKPKSGQDNGLSLSSLRGLDYDDPMWEELLDQIDFTDTDTISAVITYGLYMTQPMDVIGLVRTGDNDGPLGLTATWSGTQGHVVACAWNSAPVTAATFNTDLIYEMGYTIGQEGLTNAIQGWYAPAVNLHRSAFGGRNFEYYSEDPVISGKIAAAMVSGARQNGLFAHIKHFALNEMDHARGNVQVYATEQSMREMYLRGFEIATKTATCTEQVYDAETGGQKTVTIKAAGAYMTSMTFVGPKFTGASYELLTTVLRDEWGYQGFVITDFTSGANKSKDCGYKVGNDLWMGMRTTQLNDLDTATAQWAARKAIKNIAYTVVNSSAYNGIAPGSYAYYDMSPWMIALIVFDVVAGVVVLAGVALIVLRTLDEKKHPDKYAKGESTND
ncbi:MAG: glycoside hydrolase family 3 C-terminal domain-containing protein [Clostridia bacterium]|nr:glycoside hydrolase family 3 C-terminal domain-containing protein [Clostridia bacterium]